MTISSKTLVDCVNNSIAYANVSNSLELLQIQGIVNDFDIGFLKSVVNVSSLPLAENNKGRMIYVEEKKDYYISDGFFWYNSRFAFNLFSVNSISFAWGLNTCGQLGDASTTSRLLPVSVVGGFTDWCQVSAGCSHSLGVRTNGTAWAWGLNTYGRLGDNSTTSRLSPVSVVGGFTDWCQVSAGCSHSLGVRTNGTAWAWGLNTYGRLGDNSTTSRLSPVSVVGGFTDWCQVSAGDAHSLGVRTNGTAWAWGNNGSGRLGDNSTTSRSSPVSVVGEFTDWCQVSAGCTHSLGVRTNGTAWAWGCNGQGRLGDNSTTNRSSPVSVVGEFTDWCQVSAGEAHSLGVRTNGTTWAWGSNANGRLGDNTSIDRSSPVSVVGGFTDWCQVSAGCAHSLGVRFFICGN
jgi:alpha-tubulin suppressor-like RCC1 family protein